LVRLAFSGPAGRPAGPGLAGDFRAVSQGALRARLLRTGPPGLRFVLAVVVLVLAVVGLGSLVLRRARCGTAERRLVAPRVTGVASSTRVPGFLRLLRAATSVRCPVAPIVPLRSASVPVTA
ncbi:MAG: hypothetical protein ABSA93_20520, partial [Streptosporangiaceae bacterium]